MVVEMSIQVKFISCEIRNLVLINIYIYNKCSVTFNCLL